MSGSRVSPALLMMAAFSLVACGSPDPVAQEGLPSVGAAPPFDPAAVSGRYAVEGVTVQATTGRQREITGTLDLEVESGRYTVGFELATTAPDLEANVPVQVVGDGEGFVVGDTFTGTTEEWMALVPPAGGLEALDLGVELPQRAGRRIVSASRGSFDEDGRFEIVLENYPGSGEHYEPSMTVLTGRRIEGR